MKSDDEVLEAATTIVENQWCRGAWHLSPAEAMSEGYTREHHYCAMGAVQKAAGTRAQDSIEAFAAFAAPKKVAQVRRISARLADVILEQYPALRKDVLSIEYLDGLGRSPGNIATYVVERFNDAHTRDEMLAVFEKARINSSV